MKGSVEFKVEIDNEYQEVELNSSEMIAFAQMSDSERVRYLLNKVECSLEFDVTGIEMYDDRGEEWSLEQNEEEKEGLRERFGTDIQYPITVGKNQQKLWK